jgi:hypothetical protein
MSEKKEMSDFQKAFLMGQGVGQQLFTQKEFDDALEEAKTEIMAFAVETARHAVVIERRACADIVKALADAEDEGEVCTALNNAYVAITDRIPTQKLQ